MTAADNRELIALNSRLQLPLIMSQISHALTAATIRTSIEEHCAIAAAILAGDGASAARLVRGHLKRAAEVMAAIPADVFRTGEG